MFAAGPDLQGLRYGAKLIDLSLPAIKVMKPMRRSCRL